MSFSLILVTPNGVSYDGEANYCYIPASNGPIGILPGHAPFIGRITSHGGVVHFQETNGKVRYFGVKNGAAEVKKEKTLVLVESAKEFSSLEEAKAALPLLSEDNRNKSANEKDIKIAQALSQKNI